MVVATAAAPTLDEAQAAASALIEHGVFEVLLYGSVARGEAHEHSDIDLVAIFDDLDYTRRHEIQQQLEDVAHKASGRKCGVVATDRPEWVNRVRHVSSSFEREVATYAINLASNGTGPVNWDKEMVKPMTNNQEALQKLGDWMLSALQSVALVAFNKTISEADPRSLEEDREGSRLARMRKVCAEASMLVEQSLKTLIILHGSHPVSAKQIDNDVLSAYADETVEDYVHLSLSTAWTIYEEIVNATSTTAETEEFKRELDRVVDVFQRMDIRSAEPREALDPALHPAPIPLVPLTSGKQPPPTSHEPE